jgi:hypothetical protein
MRSLSAPPTRLGSINILGRSTLPHPPRSPDRLMPSNCSSVSLRFDSIEVTKNLKIELIESLTKFLNAAVITASIEDSMVHANCILTDQLVYYPNCPPPSDPLGIRNPNRLKLKRIVKGTNNVDWALTRKSHFRSTGITGSIPRDRFIKCGSEPVSDYYSALHHFNCDSKTFQTLPALK